MRQSMRLNQKICKGCMTLASLLLFLHDGICRRGAIYLKPLFSYKDFMIYWFVLMVSRIRKIRTFDRSHVLRGRYLRYLVSTILGVLALKRSSFSLNYLSFAHYVNPRFFAWDQVTVFGSIRVRCVFLN